MFFNAKIINRTALYRMRLKKYALTCNVSLNVSYCNAERTFIGRKNNYVVFLTLQYRVQTSTFLFICAINLLVSLTTQV